MPELSLYDIDQISRDIRRQEITFSHLLEDLIDHICCDVEYEMQNGLTFSDAYHRVKKKMGSRRIREIQEETLYLVDTKYRKMKNTMKITGIIGMIMYGFAAAFKIQHWPLAGTMMTLGAFILAFLFLPSALVVLWKETHNRKKLFLFISAFFTGLFFISGTLFKIQHWPAAAIMLSVAELCGIFLFIPALLVNRFSDQEKRAKRLVYLIGALGIVFYVLGMFFKIQHWPYSTFLMVLGVITLCIVAFPWYTWITWKDESHIKAVFIYLIIGSLLIIVPGVLVNLNLQNSYERGFYTQLEEQQVLSNTIFSNNESRIKQYSDSLCYPEMNQLHSKTTGLLKLLGSIQVSMIKESEANPGQPEITPALVIQSAKGPEIEYKLLSRPFQQGIVSKYLLPGSSSCMKLEAGLKEYDMYISGLSSGEDLKKYTGLLQPTLYLPAASEERGEISLMSGMHSLELLKNSILTVEAYSLSVIAEHN